MRSSVRVLPIVVFSLVLALGLRGLELWTGFRAVVAAHAGDAGNNAGPVKPVPDKRAAEADTKKEPEGASGAEIPDLTQKEPAPPPADAKAPKPASNMTAAVAPRPRIPGEDDFVSPAEIEVLESLAKRREELDKRSAALDMREQLLKATEHRLDQKLSQIKSIQDEIKSAMHAMDEKQKAEIASLVKVYESMKPKDAATIFEGLDQNVLLEVATHMKDRSMAPILAAMDPKKARDLTVLLAKRNQLPGKDG